MQGLIFIPDISGFTNFVETIDIDLGVSITSDLLNGIINNNPLDLDLSEIEGDALLYYKIGKPIPLQQIFKSFQLMVEAFETTYHHWKRLYKIRANLSLKLIVHYGDIIVYDIKGFKKLYGEAVIESHNLLKNGSSVPEYILITKDYVSALQQNITKIFVNEFELNLCNSQPHPGAKKIEYYFFSAIKKVSEISRKETEKKTVRNQDYLSIATKGNALHPWLSQ